MINDSCLLKFVGGCNDRYLMYMYRSLRPPVYIDTISSNPRNTV